MTMKDQPYLVVSTVGAGGPAVVGSSLAALDEAQAAVNFPECDAR